MSLLKTLLPLLLLVVLTDGEATFEGACPQIDGVGNFDQPRFLKRTIWYVQKSYKEPGARKSDYMLFYPHDNGTIYFIHGFYSTTDDRRRYSTATLSPVAATGKANFIEKHIDIPGTYLIKIIGTDYEDHAMLWMCDQSNQSNKQSLDIITKLKFPSEITLTKMEMQLNQLKKQGLNTEKLRNATQSYDCKTDFANEPIQTDRRGVPLSE